MNFDQTVSYILNKKDTTTTGLVICFFSIPFILAKAFLHRIPNIKCKIHHQWENAEVPNYALYVVRGCPKCDKMQSNEKGF